LYEVPGNYVASVSIANVFGSTQVDSSDKVIVQNPLGHKFTLIPNPIEPISYPNGVVSFNAQLAKNASHSFSPSEIVPLTGWAGNVHAHWILSKPGSEVPLQYSYGNQDIGEWLLFTNQHAYNLSLLIVSDLTS